MKKLNYNWYKNIFILSFSILLFHSSIFNLRAQTNYNIWYVTPSGAGNQTGTDRGNAWSLSSMNQASIQPGDYVYFGEGTYGNLSTTCDGTTGNLITFTADPTNSDSVWFVNSGGNGISIGNTKYVRIKNVNVKNSDSGVRFTEGNHFVILDSLYIYNCPASGSGSSIPHRGETSSNPAVWNDSIYVRYCWIENANQTSSQTDILGANYVRNLFFIGNVFKQMNMVSGGHNDVFQSSHGIGNIILANNYMENHAPSNSMLAMMNASWAGFKTILYNNVARNYNSKGWYAYTANTNEQSSATPGQYIFVHNTLYAGSSNIYGDAGSRGGGDTVYAYNNLNVAHEVCRLQAQQVSIADMDYNLHYNFSATTQFIYVENGGGSKTLNAWQTYSGGLDGNSVSADPLFTNTDILTVNQSTSPALDAGGNYQSYVEGWNILDPITGELMVKWEGFNNPYFSSSNPMPRDSNPTIGAWEFAGGGGGNNPPFPPSNPNPANGATEQPVNLTVTWTCTDPDGDPLTYDVYFGTDNNPPLVSGSQSNTSFNPGYLNTNTTYYWRIVAKDNQGHSTSGTVWHFITIYEDVTPPEVVSAALLDSVTLKIIFSEPLEQSGAQNKNNYSITNGIDVLSASLSGTEVTLTTSDHSPGTYTVTANNVTDLAGNLIDPNNNSAEYEYTGRGQIEKLEIIEADADDWYLNYTPPKTIDGITYYMDPESRWGGAIPMPDEIIFDLGEEKTVGQTRFCFYRWSQGRVYVYSVYSSTDGNSWTLCADNVSSASSEWSIHDFDLVECRYIKLVSLSNNESQWAGIHEAEIWGYDGTTSNNIPPQVPDEFNLSQNYPNPFNPSTKIRYSVPQSSNVIIKVFDILGNEIETLVNEEKHTGTYEITWYAEQLPSGIYFYKLQADSFVETKKMVLLR